MIEIIRGENVTFNSIESRTKAFPLDAGQTYIVLTLSWVIVNFSNDQLFLRKSI